MKNNQYKKRQFFPFFFLLSSVLLAVAVAYVPQFSAVFLGILLLNIGGVIWSGKKFEIISGSMARTLVGLLFVFSGIVKGVDPIGSQYMIHDYLEAYGMSFLLNLALPASFFLNLLEFTVGVCLVLNLKVRWAAYLAALMMVGFTGMTLYDALANPVPDCGCFGKALILTNWQTFYKNLILDAVLIGLLFSLSHFKKPFCCKVQCGVIITIVVLFLSFEFYNYRHLPVMNFLDWKEGKKMLVENPQPIRYYLTYKNKTTGEEKEYPEKSIPYTDTNWVAQWEFVSRRDEDPNPRLFNVVLLSRLDDEDPGYEMTKEVVGKEGYHFLIVSYDLDKANVVGMSRVWREMAKASEMGYSYDLLMASASTTPVSDVENYKQKINNPNLEFYFSDDTALKGMIRSNPGIILMKDDVVLGLWHWRDFPSLEQLSREKLTPQNGALK